MKEVIGFKDMHPAQVAEMMNFIAHFLTIADALSEVEEEEDIFLDAKNRAESLIEMFGGQAFIIDQMSPESTDLEQG